MKTFLKKACVGIGLGAAAIAMTAAPAQAQRWHRYHHYHHHGDAAGAAILGGIVGLGVGAAIASDRGGYYYNDPYYAPPPPPPPGYYGYNGYYDYRPACWTQWRWDPYWRRNVRVRVCN